MSIINQLSSTTYEQIFNDPLNTSVSKQQYSFCKTERFDTNKSYCEVAFYNLPKEKSKQCAIIGCGQKLDFTKSTIVAPSPDHYNMPSEFDRNLKVKKGKSFGIARELMTECGYIDKRKLKNPCPTNYTIKSKFKREGFTMGQKTKNINNPIFLGGKATYIENPGPGTYRDSNIDNKEGKVVSSKYRSITNNLFNPSSSQRFKPLKYGAPGPGEYEVKQKIILSNQKFEGNRIFSKTQRKGFIDEKMNNTFAPGPGNYRMPSDFGHYDVKKQEITKKVHS